MKRFLAVLAGVLMLTSCQEPIREHPCIITKADFFPVDTSSSWFDGQSVAQVSAWAFTASEIDPEATGPEAKWTTVLVITGAREDWDGLRLDDSVWVTEARSPRQGPVIRVTNIKRWKEKYESEK